MDSRIPEIETGAARPVALLKTKETRPRVSIDTGDFSFVAYVRLSFISTGKTNSTYGEIVHEH